MNSSGRSMQLLVLVLLLFWVAPASADDDYMDAGLRAQVERLKTLTRDRVLPESEDELLERVQVYWRWLNAWALDGRYVPPEAPQVVARMPMVAAGAQPGFADATLRRKTESFEEVIWELMFKDENPNGIGRASSDQSEPFEASSWITVTQHYEIGERPMPPGSVIVAAKHRTTPGDLQALNPSGPNFVSAHSLREDVVLRPVVEERGGMHGGFGFGPLPTAAFKIVSGTLQPGDRVDIVYGDTHQGSRGMRVPHFSNEAFPLPLYVRFADDPIDYSVPQIYYQVRGGELDRVHAFAPSVLAVGEGFELNVRGEDRYINRAHGRMPVWHIYLNGERVRTLPAGGDAINVVQFTGFDEPGIYRFRIQSEDGRVAGTANPILVKESPEWRVYWGDTHGHGGMAEGQGTSDEFFRFGRDDARLDFLVHSEHDIWMDDYEWQEIRDNTIKYHESGRFVTFLGYEWTVPAAWGGHHNVLFRSPEQTTRIPRQTHPRQADLYRGLRETYAPEDVLVIPHAHQPGSWVNVDNDLVRAVEITSLHGVFQWYGEMFLKEHHHVGFIGATDDHTSHPGHVILRGSRGGLAAVRAPELTRDSLFDAMRRIDAYATTGVRAIADFSVNDAGMGQAVDARRNGQIIRGQVIGTERLDHIDLIRDGELIQRWHLANAESATLADTEYLEVRVRSESTPPGMVHRVPRGLRSWRGMVSVDGASLLGYEAPGFIDRQEQVIHSRLGENGAVAFVTPTRGRGNRFILEIDCRDGCENASIKAEISGISPITVPLLQALEGMEMPAPFGDWEDAVTFRRINPASVKDYSFEYSDASQPETESWYYFRAVQLDDAEVWSSPVWVRASTARNPDERGWFRQLFNR
jgi:hypothetical protein